MEGLCLSGTFCGILNSWWAFSKNLLDDYCLAMGSLERKMVAELVLCFPGSQKGGDVVARGWAQLEGIST
jgi:hypothetical protein